MEIKFYNKIRKSNFHFEKIIMKCNKYILKKKQNQKVIIEKEFQKPVKCSHKQNLVTCSTCFRKENPKCILICTPF